MDRGHQAGTYPSRPSASRSRSSGRGKKKTNQYEPGPSSEMPPTQAQGHLLKLSPEAPPFTPASTHLLKLDLYFTHFIMIVDSLRHETYKISRYVESQLPQYGPASYRQYVSDSIMETHYSLTALAQFTTTEGLYGDFSRLLHSILLLVNLTTAIPYQPKSIQKAIYRSITGSFALYMYNRSLLNPLSKAQLQSKIEATKIHLDRIHSRNPFYRTLEDNLEIIQPPNHYPQPFSEIKSIHFAIVSRRLLDISPDEIIRAPPLEASIANIQAWQHAFAQCYSEPDLPLTHEARSIIKNRMLEVEQRRALAFPLTMSDDMSIPVVRSSASETPAPSAVETQQFQIATPVPSTVERPPIQTASMAVPFQFPSNIVNRPEVYPQSALPLEQPNVSHVPQANAYTQPMLGVPTQDTQPSQEVMRNTRFLQRIVQIITLQNSLLQDVLSTL